MFFLSKQVLDCFKSICDPRCKSVVETPLAESTDCSRFLEVTHGVFLNAAGYHSGVVNQDGCSRLEWV